MPWSVGDCRPLGVYLGGGAVRNPHDHRPGEQDVPPRRWPWMVEWPRGEGGCPDALAVCTHGACAGSGYPPYNAKPQGGGREIPCHNSGQRK